jgi:hypothetical protein
MMTELPEPIGAWASRHWPVLTAFGYALSFVVLFAGTASAAYHADVADQTAALLCGVAAILLTKLYVRIVGRIARLIHARRPPKPDQAAKSDRIPSWAVVIYAMLGLALAFAIPDPESSNVLAAIEFFVAWLAGCCTLNYLWRRRIDPDSPRALDVIDRWLDEQVAPHWPKLRRLGYMLCVALLFGGVALQILRAAGAIADYKIVQSSGPVCLQVRPGDSLRGEELREFIVSMLGTDVTLYQIEILTCPSPFGECE